MSIAEPPDPKPLDAETRAETVKAVEDAKARGWTQPDLRAWFESKGVAHSDYVDAKAGRPISHEARGTLAMISITGLPERPGTAPQAGGADDPFPDLPPEMKAAERWLLWKSEPNDDPTKKPRKVPYYVTGKRRGGTSTARIALDSPEDVAQLATYDEACAALAFYPGYAGLGFALGPDGTGQHWQGIDLDNLDQHPGLTFLVKEGLPGYTEKSPSGGGIHAVGYGRPFVSLGSNSTGIEAYAAGRYFTVTGESESRADIVCLADFVDSRLVPLHGHRPQDTSAPREASGGSLAGAMAAADLRSALASMRSDDRELWIRMGMALHSLGDQGRGLWLEWSQTSSKYDPADAARTWDSFQPERTGYQAVFAEAQRGGWVNPAAAKPEPPITMREVVDPDTGEVTEVPEDEAVAGGITAHPYEWIDAAKIPPRDVLYGRHLFRKFLSATVSPGGLGKSSLVMVEALAMVTGRDLLGEKPKGELSVWYWNGEDPKEELQRRIAAACLHYTISQADLGGRLFMDSGRDTEIIVVRDDRNGFTIAAPVVEALIREVKANRIDALIIDPFVACHAVSENDNTKIEAVAKQWMRVAEEGGCAVELVHHVRKPGGGAASETTVDDARGAGALLAKTRSARVLNAMSTTEADEIGVERAARFGFFRVDNGKANLMPRGGDAQWRRMIGVPLGNRIAAQEDEVGVVTKWQKPSALAGVTAADLIKVKLAISAGQWREDVRASNWVGLAVGGCLGINTDEPQGRARVRSMVNAWVRSGALDVVQGFDAARRPKQFVVVGGSEQ